MSVGEVVAIMAIAGIGSAVVTTLLIEWAKSLLHKGRAS